MMETEDRDSTAQAGAKGSSSGLNISLHPLVIINISDHATRKKALSGGKPQRVLGILLGIQEGRNVEIYNSFEIDYKIVNGKIQINMDYLNVKQEQYKKVFSKYEPIGWYSNSIVRVPAGEVLPGDIELHSEIQVVNENPLYVLLDTSEGAGIRDLPIQVFESELHIIDDKPTLTFAQSSYTLQTEEAERISVDQVSHLLPTGSNGASTSVSTHLGSVNSAMDMLQKRVRCIVAVLVAMQQGTIPKDHSLLRQVASLCNRLPAMDTNDFKEEFVQVYNDTLLVTYLGAMTKGTNSINELIDKFNVAYERSSRRRGLF